MRRLTDIVFLLQQDVVKLQILNLASKLCLSNPKQTKVLCQYVFRYVRTNLIEI